MRAVVHDFNERLDMSNSLSDEGHWVSFYRRIWPEMIACVRLDANSKYQKYGIDRMVFLPNGREITIDEKKREKDYGDILLEEWSVGIQEADRYVGKKIGWSMDPDKRCDFIAYAVIGCGNGSSKCYLLPFELLRLAMLHNLNSWKNSGNTDIRYPIDAPNKGYVTRNIAVPWTVIKTAINEQMYRKFGAGNLQLPKPTQVGKQMVFEW